MRISRGIWLHKENNS